MGWNRVHSKSSPVNWRSFKVSSWEQVWLCQSICELCLYVTQLIFRSKCTKVRTCTVSIRQSFELTVHWKSFRPVEKKSGRTDLSSPPFSRNEMCAGGRELTEYGLSPESITHGEFEPFNPLSSSSFFLSFYNPDVFSGLKSQNKKGEGKESNVSIFSLQSGKGILVWTQWREKALCVRVPKTAEENTLHLAIQ